MHALSTKWFPIIITVITPAGFRPAVSEDVSRVDEDQYREGEVDNEADEDGKLEDGHED
jgi:hypothetical protein